MNSAKPPQPPPASTTRSPGFKLQLAAHVMHLRLLRLLDRHCGIGEIRARVLQRLAIEPQLVEIVADVVVVMNVALRVGQIGRKLPAAREHGADRRVLGRIAVGFEQQRQQIAADLQAARAVEIAEVQIRVDDELPQRLAVENPHAHGAVTRGDLGLVPKLDAHGRGGPEPARDLLDEPTLEPARLRARRSGLVKSNLGFGDAQRLQTTSVHGRHSAYNSNPVGRPSPCRSVLGRVQPPRAGASAAFAKGRTSGSRAAVRSVLAV